MAKPKLNIQKQNFPSSVSEAYNNLLGVKNDNPYVNISLSLLDEIGDQPFPINEEKIVQIADSIANIGLIEPIIVTRAGDRYKIISGRHRFRACRKLGKEEIACSIKDVSEDVARYILIATNTDRNNEYSPMVYAKAYSEQLELMKKLGKKSTVSAIAEQNGLSRKQIYRYIRLTNLITEFQNFVDNGIISIQTAVEFSFLSAVQQSALLEYFENLDLSDTDVARTLNLEFAQGIHKAADDLSDEEFLSRIEDIMFHSSVNTGAVKKQPIASEDNHSKQVEHHSTVKENNNEEHKASHQETIENTSYNTETTENEEVSEMVMTVQPDISEKQEKDTFEEVVKGYMLLALQKYGINDDHNVKASIDELYQTTDKIIALEIYRKLYN